ncbi:kinase superfamily with octicosapeptide/Phox/Bem1p domain-containing protein [Actinidia rufa]|uniref:Kinase superfamily with octicosapeptide/Phox/Bem1p domain-containing protein n=1 Tax=Actinidia rufa TaxID=165716 RepID=A0A7J0E539_9ERIC|nr:kinase superfamily with octicosapeptide/Phox/Bem1p domain-containing protein [Actinidia rufa]
MAFDQNSIPKDLHPLNIARTMPEEMHIAPVTTSRRNIEFFYRNPPHDGSPGSIPGYYPGTVSDTGFVGLGYSNVGPGVASWGPRMPTSVVAIPGANLNTGYCHTPNSGTRVGGNASDQAIEEGGEDSVSGKKVKFLCSFGGQILPRPSDGMLRYVGGQTRIIGVRRDVSFNGLVQKMADTSGQNVVIKYQLPDEDLDALVSVSCPDDLENMMDEYEKLAERSSDGLAKLRVFLFSSSEIDSVGMMQFGEFQDSGQRYFEAVNGILDGVGGGVLARKESITSAASTQNSDVSGIEAFVSVGHGQGDIIGPPPAAVLSPTANSATSQESAPRLVGMDPNAAIYVEASSTPLAIPVITPVPPQNISSQTLHDLPAQYFPDYVDPHQETLNRADYVQVPSQMEYPTQLLGTIGPMFTHPQFHDNPAAVSSHPFNPMLHMTTTPSAHVSMKPNMVLPLQSQQMALKHLPDESTLGARVMQLPGDQSYNAYQAQVPFVVMGGGYGWNQVPQPEQVVFSEGLVPNQPVNFPEQMRRFKDCYMCEKALPHAHSDTIVQDQRESPSITVSDLNPLYHSLRLEDKTRAMPMNKAVVTGALGEGIGEQQLVDARPKILSHIDHEVGKPQLEAGGAPQNVMRPDGNDRIILQNTDSPDHPNVSIPQSVVGLAAGVPSPYGVVMATLSQPCHENSVQQLAEPPQYQVKQEILINKPVNSDIHPVGGMPFQMSDHLVYESPKDYSSKLPGIASKEDIVESYDHLKQIDGGMEKICPPEVFGNKDQSKSPSENLRKEDILEARPQQIAGREPFVENTFSKLRMVMETNHSKPNEMMPSSNEVSYLHNLQPSESYEVEQPPLLGVLPTSHQESKIGVNYFTPDGSSYGNPAFSGVDSAHSTERLPPIDEWKDDPSRFHSKLLPGNVIIMASNGNTPDRVGDIQDTSNSLFSNQDPWNLQHDTHFPPPIPTKIAIRKEGFGMRDPFGGNNFGNSGELPVGNKGEVTEGMQLEDGFYTGSNRASTTQGSAEELIKQELQAVAEGVAASVLQPSVPSNPDIMHERSDTRSEAKKNIEAQNTDVELHRASSEDIKANVPGKTNLGFPVSDGIGRLQIIQNSDLEELQELGSGTFGTVYHGKWRGTDVAIKRINDRCFAGKPSEQERMFSMYLIRDMISGMRQSILLTYTIQMWWPFYGVVLDGPGDSVATVTEYMVNGSLRSALQKNERNLDKRKRLLIAMDVAFGMEYLHGKNIVHFDLKSDNLLVNLRDPQRPICKSPDLFSLFLTSPWFGDNFHLPDFFVDWPPNPSTAGYGMDRGTPIRGPAVLGRGGEMTAMPLFRCLLSDHFPVGLRVLVVDDDPTCLKRRCFETASMKLALILCSLGYVPKKILELMNGPGLIRENVASHLQVGDLGLSKVKCQTLISGGVRGTLPWMAPELLNGSSSLVSEKVDVFSFGIVLWELLTGEEPYADLHYGAIIGGIVSNTLRPPVPESCSPEWRLLMENCWSSEPSERPNFTEIANELRAMAVKVPPKAQSPHQVPSTQPQAKS